MLEVETRCPQMEKQSLALVTVARKLKPYFQAYSIIELTDQPLRQVLHKPEASARLVELSEFAITYQLRTVIKLQALADFVAECAQVDKDVDIRQMIREQGPGRVWTITVDG